jgi:ABC-type branched-subunit amino acid transport system ATPase component
MLNVNISKIRKLSKKIGGIRAVRNCSFEIKKNSIVAVIGPNGAGKSTLFNLISGVIREDRGKIFFKGIDITKFNPAKRSNLGISRLFQRTQLFKNLTVRENLILAIDNEDTKFWKNIFGKNKLTKEKEKKVKEALKLIEMGDFENIIGRDLSYGQIRLVEFARTVLNPHELLILDEPVAGLNPRLRNKIAERLKRLKREGKTILLIEHDMDFALNLADEVIVLDKGFLIARGTSSKIRQNKKVLNAYLGD